jgi:hypothetical protein
MAMQPSTLTRSLLISAAVLFAGPALAQSSDKEPSTASKQGSAKSATTKPAATAKRLDFAPANGVKQTATQAPSSQPAQAPARNESHCHEQGSDA